MSRHGLSALLGLLLVLAPSQAQALAKFTISTTDSAFRDPTPLRPVDGNSGVTLGEQRRLALEHALEIWGKALDSSVPIVVEASFQDLGCTKRGAVLAHAFPTKLYADLPGATKFWYPSPLADRLAERDLSPGLVDLSITFNLALDSSCVADAGGWYYGFEITPVELNGFISAALHELAHGLGFSSWVNPATGVLYLPGELDVFTSHILDLDLGKTWAELSEAERARSATNVRRVVWDGQAAQRATQTFLEPGVPSLTLEPALPGFQGWISDATGALNSAQHPVQVKVVLPTPSNGCTALRSDVRGAVVLLTTDAACAWPSAVGNALVAGASAALFIVGSKADQPPPPLDAVNETVALPVATLSAGDGTLLSNAIRSGHEVVATLGGQQMRLLGADDRAA